MKKNNETETIKEESFFYKYKNDSKYKAKIQLLAWGIFIVILIVFLNISSINHSRNSNIVNGINNVTINNDTLFNKIHNNNYAYEIEIVKRADEKEEMVKYNGSLFKSKQMIKKISSDGEYNYYIDDSLYYVLNNNTNKYEITNSNKIYDFLAYSFLDISNIINYINVGTIDHRTEYNDGKKEISYKVLLKDIVINGKDNEYITIDIIEEENNIKINIDYTLFYNLYGINPVDLLTVKYNINSIGEMEEFVNIDLQ